LAVKLDRLVPPLAVGSTPVISVAAAIEDDATFTKSEPFHTTNTRVPAGTDTPVVGPTPTIFTS
jgi:hypothetical protein